MVFSKLESTALLETSSTFSIVARCPESLALGVCVSTASPAVGNRVPYVEADVGAIATQARANTLYGTEGLLLLKNGLSPQGALETILEKDPDRESRQVIIIDKEGRKAAFTGKQTLPWNGHLVGENYAVGGNLLVGDRVIKSMAFTFENSEGILADRLVNALESGRDVGGDRRGATSAALQVAYSSRKRIFPLLNLKVDKHESPVEELRRIFESYKRQELGR